MILEESVALVVLHCSRRRVKRLAIDFEDAPLAIAADKKIGLSVLAAVLRRQSRDAIGKKKDTASVKCFSNWHLTL